MKKGLTSFVLVTSLVTGTAFGATTPTTTAVVPKKKPTNAAPVATNAKSSSNATPATSAKKKNTDVIKTSAAAPAAVANAGTSTATTAKPANESFMSRLSLRASLDYFGASITQPGSSKAPDRDNLEAGPVRMENGVLAGYRIDKNQSLGAGVFFNQVLYGDEKDTGTNILDAQVRYTHGSIYKKGGFNLGTQIRLYAPTSTLSQNNDLLTQARWYGLASYEMPKSRFSFELTTMLRQYLYTNNATAAAQPFAPRFMAYVGPQVNYQVSPKVKAWLLVEELGVSSMKGGTFALGADGDIEPGITWDVSDRVSFSPYLDIKTHGAKNFTVDTTSINANLTIRAL